MRLRAALPASLAVLALASWSLSCSRARNDASDGAVPRETGVPAADSSTASPAPRPGMVWIPAGTLRAGTPRDQVPRVADEELPGVEIEMGGFYIDVLPFPNEPGAIPTSNVTHDEAAHLCSEKGKRLCTELEWERACKGPTNTVYEYGDSYRAAACGTGIAPEQAARRPSGELSQCKSAFGVADLHGSSWQWTSSAWGRGAKDPNLAVLRGGNAVAGQLVGRCANALGRSITKKSPTMGLRCCAGDPSPATVDLTLEGTPGLASAGAAKLAARWSHELLPDHTPAQGWTWIPVPNETMDIVITCKRGPRLSCDLLIGRALGEDKTIVARVEVKSGVELARIGTARKLRIRGLDERGSFSREITYVYGLVEIAEPKRP